MSQIDHLIWQSVLGADVQLNPDAAIYKFWRACRDQEQFLGAPITREVDLGDGRIQQAFASGAVVQWSADGGATLISS
jgi:hypothetical protein